MRPIVPDLLQASHSLLVWSMRRGAVMGWIVTMVVGCGMTTATSGKITYAFHIQYYFSHSPADKPTLLNQTVTALCAEGESVLAGGYYLAPASTIITDWKAAHPAPKLAKPDADGLFHPIPDLVRAVSSQPHIPGSDGLDGWDVDVEGMTYPADSDRTIAAFAYCARGLSTKPVVTAASIIATIAGGNIQAEALCPEGTLASGGGYVTGNYSNVGSTTAHVPVSVSFLVAGTSGQSGWLVQTDPNPTFTLSDSTIPAGPLRALAVCVSTKDFAAVQSTEATGVQGLTIYPGTPDLNMVPYQVGSDMDYQGQIIKSSPCPTGAFLLPPGYAVEFNGSGGQDLRVDGAWESGTLTEWSVIVSFGGAPTYHSSRIVHIYASCLMPR